MTNIILLIACSLCGYACGKYLENRIKRKGEFLSDLNRYVTLLKVNVEGKQLELSEFNAQFGSSCSEIFKEYLLDGKLKCTLSKLQRESVEMFFSNLSRSSSQELTKHLEYYGAVFESMDKQFTQKEIAGASMYVKLGILLGVMIGIVLM